MTTRDSLDQLRLIRLTPADAKEWSDDYLAFRRLVLENEPSYPSIQRWLDERVRSGVRSKERVAYVAFAGETPIASAVVKIGADTKFCHLRLSPDIRDRNLGELFFCLMAFEARGVAKNVHFTLPESLWAEKTGFFESFSFNTAERAKRQYRLFEDELRCETPFHELWTRVMNKLPALARRTSIRGHSMASALVLSMAGRYARAILDGRKSVEIRRRFSEHWKGSRAVVCSDKALLGELTIRQVVSDRPGLIWQRFSSEIGCTRQEFDDYTTGTDRVSAVVVDEVVPYLSRIPLVHLETITGHRLIAPQSYCSTERNDGWSGAVAVAALLHGSIRSYTARTIDRAPVQLRLM